MDSTQAAVVISLILLVILTARIVSQVRDARQASRPPDTSIAAPGRRGGSGTCESCGYDLRGTPDHCPECGATVLPHRLALDPARLLDEWPRSPIEPRVPGDEESPVLVWDAPHPAAGELLANQLLARGLRAVVRRRTHAVQVGAYSTRADYHAVYVWTDDVDAAHAVIRRFAIAPAVRSFEESS